MTRPWLAAAALVLLAGCADPSDEPPAAQSDPPDFTPVETITVDEDGFDPDEVTIDPGDTLELANSGEGPHSFDGGERFDTGNLLPGESTTLRLEEPGTVEVSDGENPDAALTIEVRALDE